MVKQENPSFIGRYGLFGNGDFAVIGLELRQWA